MNWKLRLENLHSPSTSTHCRPCDSCFEWQERWLLFGCCLTLTSWNFLAFWLVILQSIGSGIRDSLQLTNWRSRTVVSDALLTTVTRDGHDMTVWNICIRKQGYLRCPDWESLAPTEIVFIISPSLLTPSGLFSYQTVSSPVIFSFGYWKNAVHDGFNLATYSSRLSNASSSDSVLCSLVSRSVEGLLVSSPGWFLVASSCVMIAYSRLLASFLNANCHGEGLSGPLFRDCTSIRKRKTSFFL